MEIVKELKLVKTLITYIYLLAIMVMVWPRYAVITVTDHWADVILSVIYIYTYIYPYIHIYIFTNISYKFIYNIYIYIYIYI